MEALVWHNEKRKVNSLIPFEGNPRQMTKKQVADLTKSLEKFNLVEIPAIDTDNKIISGHQRLKILQLLNRGEEEIDVRMPNRKLTDEEFREYNIRANKNLGEWNWDLLANFDEELLKLSGFETEELDKIFKGEVTEDEVPAVDDTPAISKYGEVYQLGRHRLMCGDSTKKEDVERLMDGKKADMVFTDPPYGVSYGDKNAFLNAIGRPNRIQENIEADTLKPEEMKQLWYDAWVSMKIVLKAGGCFYICSADATLMMMMMSIAEAGLKHRQLVIWVKNNIVIGRRDYKAQHENLLYGWNDGSHKFYGGGGESTVWRFDKPMISKLHPTMKPIALCAKAIKNSSKADDIVLDLFGGSGSTLIACEQTNRICYMAEIDEKYVDVIRKRYAKFIGKEAEWQNITPKL